jgi:DNA-binding winged helix-turn-helix (wHTH) protein
MLEDNHPTGYRIGLVTLDLVNRQIRRQGQILRCGKLTFELLALLAKHAPAVVGRETIAEALWKGRYVSPATIKRRVALLRLTLGDRADEPAYVKVVRGQGYALVPEVRVLEPRPVVLKRRIGYGVAASAMILTFVLGAEIGFKDGLSPRIQNLQGSTSIYVTSLPHDLPRSEFSFVMGAAQEFLGVINDTRLIDRLNQTRTSGEGLTWDSLTVMANANDNDVESIYVTLALLNGRRPDYRVSSAHELASWVRVLEDGSPQASAAAALSRPGGQGVWPTISRHEVHVFPAAAVREGNYVLVANFSFDRAEVAAYPRAVQSDAALSVATAIDEQVAQLAAAGGR